MSLSDFARSARAADLSEPHSQNGRGTLLDMEDLLTAIRQVVGEEVRAAMKEAGASSTTHLAEPHRSVSWIRYFLEWLRNMVTKYTNLRKEIL